MVVRLVGYGGEGAPGPVLVRGAEETAHEDAIPLLPRLGMARHLLGLERLHEVRVHRIAHPLMQVPHQVVDAFAGDAGLVLARLRR